MNPEKLARLPEILFEIGKAIGAHDRLDGLLSRISELVCQATGAEACSIMLLDPGRACLLGKVAFGLQRRDIEALSFRIGEGVAGWVAEHGEAARIDDVTIDPRYKVLPDSQNTIRALACVPIDGREGRVGVLTLTSARVAAFAQGDVELLGFIAKTIALDVDNLRLRRLTVTDPLTGAFNKRYLGERLPEALAAAVERGEPLGLAILDVDHFKAINDAYGHPFGDRVLTEVAGRLRGAIRGGDELVRFGGEEFVVILPRADAAHAVEVGERMRRKLADEPLAVEGRSVPVRISVGIAEHRMGRETGDDLVRRADVALGAAKGRGRNRVELAP